MKISHHYFIVACLYLLQGSAAQTCSDEVTAGVDGNKVVCCPIGCDFCAGTGCSQAGAAAGFGADECCGSNIKDSGVYCGAGENPAPCILGDAPDATDTCSDDVTVGVDGKGIVCCSPGCEFCAGTGCSQAGAEFGLGADDCCGSNIQDSGVYCGAGENPAPCILGTDDGTADTCSDEVTEGVDGNGVVCCPIGCTFCAGEGCSQAGADAGFGADECCGSNIKDSGVYCGAGDNEAPCILGNAPTPAPTPLTVAPTAQAMV